MKGKNWKQQEDPLSARDRATPYVRRRNLVNCCIQITQTKVQARGALFATATFYSARQTDAAALYRYRRQQTVSATKHNSNRNSDPTTHANPDFNPNVLNNAQTSVSQLVRRTNVLFLSRLHYRRELSAASNKPIIVMTLANSEHREVSWSGARQRLLRTAHVVLSAAW